MFNFGIDRPQVTQSFRTFPVTLVGGAAAVPLDPSGSKQQLITSYAISNPAAGSSIYIGTAGVTAPGGANPGFEIQAGTAPAFRVNQEGRQQYELQALLAIIAEMLGCQSVQLEKIPVQVFDMSQVFAFCAVATTFTVITFPLMYL